MGERPMRWPLSADAFFLKQSAAPTTIYDPRSPLARRPRRVDQSHQVGSGQRRLFSEIRSKAIRGFMQPATCGFISALRVQAHFPGRVIADKRLDLLAIGVSEGPVLRQNGLAERSTARKGAQKLLHVRAL